MHFCRGAAGQAIVDAGTLNPVHGAVVLSFTDRDCSYAAVAGQIPAE
jgi:hypothetical protein